MRELAQASERWGYDLSLIAELNLNDIKGVEEPALDAWSTAAALAAVTGCGRRTEEYSVSNRGLRPNLVGTPEQLRERIAEYEAAGLDLQLLQMNPQAEEMEHFAAQVTGTAEPLGPNRVLAQWWARQGLNL